MLVFVGAEPGEFRDARIEPAKGIGKFQGMKLADFVAIAQCYEARLSIGTAVEGKNERAIEAGGVVGAGRVAEVMLEMRRAGAAAKEILKLLLGG